MTLRVLGRPSSINVRKVLWTCAELDLPFEHVESDAQLLARNPNRLVPVIQDGDFVLWESNSICRYLAGKQARGMLLPHEPRGARAGGAVDGLAGHRAQSAWRYAFYALVRKIPAHTDPAAIATSVEAWNRLHAPARRSISRMAASSSPASSSRSPTWCSGYLPTAGC